ARRSGDARRSRPRARRGGRRLRRLRRRRRAPGRRGGVRRRPPAGGGDDQPRHRPRRLEPVFDDVLDRIADVYGSVRHSIALAPAARPDGVAAMLRERGYEPAHAWVKFARAAAAPPAPQTRLRIERIGPERAEEFTAVLAAGFEIPQSVTAMLAHLPGRPGW